MAITFLSNKLTPCVDKIPTNTRGNVCLIIDFALQHKRTAFSNQQRRLRPVPLAHIFDLLPRRVFSFSSQSIVVFETI